MFSFKQFTIHQDRCAMKVGTDGVLLGAWTPLQPCEATHVLDIGCGTGLISLMLSQRLGEQEHTIKALEIDADAALQAEENIAASPFKEHIDIINKALQNFAPNETFNHIVSNPPFFIKSLKSPKEQRNTARHTDSLSFEELIKNTVRLLDSNGYFSVIIPHDSIETFIEICKTNGLKLCRFSHVYPTIDSTTPKRALLNFKKTNDEIDVEEENLTIETSRHIYTEEYIELTREFYLKM